MARWYLLYSFAPGATVVNGFLQTLIGLYDYAHASDDPKAARLFAAGDAEARFAVPRYDTGAWSLYQPGQEDDLSYHELVTGFLHATVRSRPRGRLLHDRGAFRRLPEDAAGPPAADTSGPHRRAGDDPLPSLEALARRYRRGLQRTDACS